MNRVKLINEALRRLDGQQVVWLSEWWGKFGIPEVMEFRQPLGSGIRLFDPDGCWTEIQLDHFGAMNYVVKCLETWKRHYEIVGDEPDQSDTIPDIGKIPEKKRRLRPMNTAAADCARRFRDDDGKTPMKTIVADYVEQHGGKASSIERVLADNPEQWKPTKSRH